MEILLSDEYDRHFFQVKFVQGNNLFRITIDPKNVRILFDDSIKAHRKKQPRGKVQRRESIFFTTQMFLIHVGQVLGYLYVTARVYFFSTFTSNKVKFRVAFSSSLRGCFTSFPI